MNQAQRDSRVYKLAKEFLLNKRDKGVTPEILNKYLSGEGAPRLSSIFEVFRLMLESAQSAHMKAGVIGGSIDGIGNLSAVLFEFNSNIVAKEYTAWEDLLNRITCVVKPRGEVLRARNSIWPGFCTTILSASEFLSQYIDAEEFYAWCDSFDKDDRSRLALPLLLSQEIYGFGFALACDFLKEIGYLNYGKPDRHIRDILEGTRLCPEKTSNYIMLKTIIRVAKNAQVTPYAVDKVFWLIGSGNFYLDKNKIGRQGRIGRMKSEFIKLACSQLG